MTTVRSLPQEAFVVNVGLPDFADAVAQQGASVVQVDWRVPADGDPALVRALTRLYATASPAIDEANAEIVRRLDAGVPLLVGTSPAHAVVPDLDDRMLLHAGPPIDYAQVCDPLGRSMRAAVVAEGWAGDVAGAQRLLVSGGVRLDAANDHATVVPMATALGPTAPVWVAQNGDVRACAPIDQGPGDVAWFGRDSRAAFDCLVFLRDVAQPRLQRVLEQAGPLDIMALAAQGVQMGDDVHLRTQATTNLLVRTLLPHLQALGSDPGSVAMAEFLGNSHLFFLTIAMAGAKSLTLSAETVQGGTVVTTMARNGTTFGVKVAGSQQWHVCAAPPVGDALYYSGYTAADAALDIGDSAVLELVGLGGAAAAASPAVAGFLGGSMADAARATEEMRAICVGVSSRFKLPSLGFRGSPLAVDVRPVVGTGVRPKVTTGVLHATSGAGQIGAGVATAPPEAFREALLALAAVDQACGPDVVAGATGAVGTDPSTVRPESIAVTHTAR